MAIKFQCPNCKKALSVKDQLAGKKAACPDCKKVLVIPQPTPEPAPVAAADLDDFAAQALADRVEDKAAPQSIDFSCPQCDEPVSFGLDFGGKQAQCPSCRRIIKVPVPKIKDPANWKQVDKSVPTGARRDVEPAPEGAWGATNAKMASREALEEAGVIGPDLRKSLSRGQKITRGLVAGGAALAVAVGGFVLYSFYAQGEQDQLVDRALQSVDETRGRETSALLSRSAGEYFLGTDSREAAGKANAQFAKARELLSKARPSYERDLLLADLALAQIDLGGEGKVVEQGKRLTRKEAATELNKTMALISASGARLHALRVVGRKLIEEGQATTAAQLPNLYANPAGGGDDTLPYEATEAIAVVGLELLRAGQKQSAETMLANAQARFVLIGAGGPPPMAPSVVALSLALGKGEPKATREDGEQVAVGRAEGLARQGNLAAARDLAQVLPETKLRAMTAVAGVTVDATPPLTVDLDQAAALLDGELRGKTVPPWALYRLALLSARASQFDRGLTVAGLIPDAGLRGRAQVEVQRWKLAGSSDAVDESWLEKIEKQPVPQAMARETLARHNAKSDRGTVKAVEAWDEAARPFGLIGAALGVQDRGR